MKICIDIKQLNKLSENHKGLLLKEMFNTNFMVPFRNELVDDNKITSQIDLSSMINYLGSNWYFAIVEFEDGTMKDIITVIDDLANQKYSYEFCDILWEAVKYKLKNKEKIK